MDDELTRIRELFFVGAFEAVEAEGNIQPHNDLAKMDLASMKLRSSIAKAAPSEDKIKGIMKDASPAEKAIALVSQFFTARDRETRTKIIDALQSLYSCGGESTVRTMLASAIATEGELGGDDRMVEAIRLMGEGGPLEAQALRAQFILMADQPDLLSQTQSEMCATSDDASVTKLVTAWSSIATGNFQEAYLTFGDLESSLGQEATKSSHTISNGKAVANMHRGQWPEALEDIQTAKTQVGGNDTIPSSGQNDIGGGEAVTLANLVVCSHRMRKVAAADKAFEALETKYPSHPMVRKVKDIDLAFSAFEKTLKT